MGAWNKKISQKWNVDALMRVSCAYWADAKLLFFQLC
jgi:hypothetical protein